MYPSLVRVLALLALVFISRLPTAHAGIGDPQVATDHQWYPGELACSSFARLFATQAQLFEKVTGVKPATDEQKALAAWLWRNTHYFHGEEGAEDLWGKGFKQGGDVRTREYWTGLFAHGFGLCGTTHSQWTTELNALFGPNRGRAVGVAGHNSCEVFLTGGAYGAGKWVLLDHDLSTVAFSEDGKSLLSIAEIQRNWKQLLDRGYKPERQHGWPVCGLHQDDRGSFAEYNVAEYFAGYEGVPPMVHLRAGETLRRYLNPGLEDGKTFVFWGRNYNTAGIPGPERSLTWVNQPDKLFGGVKGVQYKAGQARYGNAVFTYRPNFKTAEYKEGVIAESDKEITFEFYSPYIIAATPAANGAWGIYEPGCTNGLVLRGKAPCSVSVSIDQGQTWKDVGAFRDGLDLTDQVKGYRQYFLRLSTGAKALTDSALTITTICQANPSTMPQLKDDGSTVQFSTSGRAVVSAGPTLPQARAHLVEGAFGTSKVTMELATPRGEKPVAVYAVAHVQSGNPPDSKTKYRIEASTDGGTTWAPIVKDWSITHRGDEPKDFWSQSLCWGSLELPANSGTTVRVRFANDGNRDYSRAELHLVYHPKTADATKVTFHWTDDRGPREESHVFPARDAKGSDDSKWKVPTTKNVQTQWIEFAPAKM